MADHNKSRDELLAELTELRRYAGELEKRLRIEEKAPASTPAPDGGESRQDRLPLDVTIEFIGDFDVAKARGVDLSGGGLCFELDHDLPFEMRFFQDGREQMRRARCIWLRRKPEGGYFLGLQFIEPEPGAVDAF